MMDLIPTMVDGAVVFNLKNSCSVKNYNCEPCVQLVLCIHNWLKHAEVQYAIFDLLDEKDICSSFLTELLQLRKRLRFPFLFVGVMDRPQNFLESYSYDRTYSVFVTPEDAVRALRIHNPGITEHPIRIPVDFGKPMLDTWRRFQEEQLG